jgi:hypothetical protein
MLMKIESVEQGSIKTNKKKLGNVKIQTSQINAIKHNNIFLTFLE